MIKEKDIARLLQIRRAHRSAEPKAANPAWCNTHADLGFVLTLLEEHDTQTAWQPIETAPTDGTWILLYTYGYTVPSVGRYRAGCWKNSDARPFAGPTHWMAIPPTPSKDPKQ